MAKPSLGARLTGKLMNFERKLAGLERKTAPLDDLNMVYYDNENVGKPVMVLVHGYTADKTMWHRPAKLLGKDFHIIAPDMAGHGETPYRKDANYSIATQIKWLAKLLGHLNIEQAHIAGSSMGGFIAAAFAVAYPEKTQSIILLDPAGITSPEPSDIAKVYETGRNMFLPKTRAEFFEFLDLVMVKRPYIPKFALNTMADVHISRRGAYDHIFADFFDTGLLEDELHNIQAPTLLVWGKQDQILHVSAAPIWQAGIPNCQTVIYDDLGHVPSMEATKRTVDAMVEFVGGVE